MCRSWDYDQLEKSEVMNISRKPVNEISTSRGRGSVGPGQKCCYSECEAQHLPRLCAYPHLWSRSVGNDRKNLVADKADQDEISYSRNGVT